MSFGSLPLALLYWGATGLRNVAYDVGIARRRSAPIPVVSVGNLVVGGTGKTPVSAWIARRLAELGTRPALVLRGYGADEPALHRRWAPDLSVVVGADRVAGVRSAAQLGADVAVIDDGFQHRRLARDLDIVLVAAEHTFPGRLLPRGPFREPASRITRADVVMITRRTATTARVEELTASLERLVPLDVLLVARLEPGGFTTLDGESAQPPRGDVFAATGVASPERFAELLDRVVPGSVEVRAFPDHHPFDENDARELAAAAGARPLAITEKDAVKLIRFRTLLPETLVLPLIVRMERGAEVLEHFLARVASAVAASDHSPAGRAP